MSSSAIIMAAGAGTRMKSKRPKVAHELLGKPLVRWVIDAAKNAGVDDVVCVVGHGREQVEPLVADNATVIVQEQRLGTADAVNVCRSYYHNFKGSLLVLSGDSPLIKHETLKSLITLREKEQAAVVVLTMKLSNPFGYGRIIRTAEGIVERIVEQKDCSPAEAQVEECNSGFYCFDAEILFSALEKVGSSNAQGEFYLTDILEICRKAGKKVLALTAIDPQECLGINSRNQLAEATKHMQQRINDHFMSEGVTMTDPHAVWIGPDVKIAQDVELLPLTFLYGNTTVGQDCVIGPNSRIYDSQIGDGCVLEETIVHNALLEEGASCGPRAYLRAGVLLEKNAKAGAHVEIKKSIVGENSKVPHLSYIGDAVIGKNVNVGAGSITCNYDGIHKSQTIIEDGAFIGSDTMLVAPVTIGQGATVGAGSTITKNVSPHSLALGRARQTEIAEWKQKSEKAKPCVNFKEHETRDK